MVEEMEDTIPITHGLLATDKDIVNIPISQIEEYLSSHNDCYEQRRGKVLRAYMDIDGQAADDMSIDDFETLCCMVEVALTSADLPPRVIMTSNKYQAFDLHKKQPIKKNKLSFRIHFTEAAGSFSAIKHYVGTHIYPIISKALADCDINLLISSKAKEYPPTYLEWDDRIYCAGKLRCVGSSKYAADIRPLNIVSDNGNGILDSLINYIPDHTCEALPEPVEAVEAKTQVSRKESVAPTESCKSASTASTAELDEKKAVIIELLNGISDKRFTDYTFWIQAGMICFNEDMPLEVWDNWSRKASNYDGSCARMWAGFRKSALTISTLWLWLKEDNRDLFRELCAKRTDFEKLVRDPGNHCPIAQHFYAAYSLDYLYCPDTKWWYMNNHRVWINCGKDTPPGLTLSMNRLFTAERITFEGVLAKRKEAAVAAGNQTLLEELDQLSKKIPAFVSHTIGKASTILCSIIHFLKDYYAESTLLMLQRNTVKCVPALMNAKLNLFAFNNAVVDLDTGKSRPIEARDYISFTTGYDMPLASNPKIRSTMITKLKTIWESDDMFDYVMRIIATCLSGARRLEEFYVLTGEGGNGKGMLTELIERIFGAYFGTMDQTVLTTRDESADRASPSIFNLYGRRYVNTTEPDAGIKLREDKIKKLTGGDNLVGRQLYGNPITFKPQFGLFLQCNNIPKMSGLTRGIVRRLRIIPFPFNFVENPIPNTNERKADFALKTEMCVSEEWRNEFILYMLDIYQQIRNMGFEIPRPTLVSKATDEYLDANNIIGAWFKDNYVKDIETDKAGKSLHMLRTGDVLRRFKEEHNEQRNINDIEFRAGLKFNNIDSIKTDFRIGGVVQSRNVMCIVGYREITDDDRAQRAAAV